MAEAVYLMCAITSIVTATLLVRSYWKHGTRLLMWSALSFVGFAINNILLFVDLVVHADLDMSFVRSGTALAAVLLLCIGVFVGGLVSMEILAFLHGAITLGCLLVALKFLKFWRSSKDRFHLWFAAAFLAFAVGWVIRIRKRGG